MDQVNYDSTEKNPYAPSKVAPVAEYNRLSLDNPAWFALACCGASLALLVLAFIVSLPNGEPHAPSVRRLVGFIGTFMALPALGLSGAVSMLQRRRYGLAVAAACGMMIPLLGPCFGLTFPLGVWILVVLLRADVRESFAVLTASLADADEDPEEALAAASRLDQSGDWDEAIARYRSIAARRPERAAYAERCIAEIEKKRAAGS